MPYLFRQFLPRDRRTSGHSNLCSFCLSSVQMGAFHCRTSFSLGAFLSRMGGNYCFLFLRCRQLCFVVKDKAQLLITIFIQLFRRRAELLLTGQLPSISCSTCFSSAEIRRLPLKPLVFRTGYGHHFRAVCCCFISFFIWPWMRMLSSSHVSCEEIVPVVLWWFFHQTGYKKAMSAIIDGKCYHLYCNCWQSMPGPGSGTVKGFAYTLIISPLFPMFTALVISRTVKSGILCGWMQKRENYTGRAKQPTLTGKGMIIILVLMPSILRWSCIGILHAKAMNSGQKISLWATLFPNNG